METQSESFKPEAPLASSEMGECCTTAPPTDPAESSSGEFLKLGDTDVYISRPADSGNSGAPLLLLLTNAVGTKATINQIQADHFAREGYFVVMPEMFADDPAPTAATVATEQDEEEAKSLLGTIKMSAVEGIKGFLIDLWLARNTAESKMPGIFEVLKKVKETYGDKEYIVSLGTYAVGYCYGGNIALKLAGTDEITAAAAAHATLITKADFEAVKKPVTFACVENDPYFPDEIREEGRKILQQNNVEHNMEIYKGVNHGFAVYKAYPGKEVAASQQRVFQQFVQFLRQH